MLVALAVLLFSTLILLLTWEQIVVQRISKGLHGPKWVLPFIGTLAPILNPYEFVVAAPQREERDLWWSYFMGKFILFTKDISLAKRIIKEQGTTFSAFVSFTSKQLFGSRTLTFFPKGDHDVLRRALGPIFTRRGVLTLLPAVEGNIRKHLRLWIDEREITVAARATDLVFDFVTEAFLGNLSPAQTKSWRYKYHLVSKAITAAPVNFPGTTYWRGAKARQSLTQDMKPIVELAIKRADDGQEPTTIIEHWAKALIESKKERLEDADIRQVIEDNLVAFLFAGQDTSASAISSMFARLSANPDVLEKVRAEQTRVRPQRDEPITADAVNQMKYTCQVVKEVLRLDSPAVTAPVIAEREFKIKGLVFPKGTVVFPFFLPALLHKGFVEPLKFDPNRFGLERREHALNAGNYLTFGVGAYRCLGNKLIEVVLTLTAAIAAMDAEWRRIPTVLGNKMTLDSTRRLADGCVIAIQAREA